MSGDEFAGAYAAGATPKPVSTLYFRGMPDARWLGLSAIVLAAFLLRWIGIDRELPHRIEPDSSLVFQLQRFEHDPAVIPRDKLTGPYPSLPGRVLSLLPYPEVPSKVSGPGDERAQLEAASHPFLVVRKAVAILSTVGVLLSWFLARRFVPPKAAILVPILTATSLLAILFAGQGRPHGIQATLALAAVLLALRVRERASPLRVLAAAAAAAAAGATLQNGMIALCSLGAAVYLGASARRARGAALLEAGIVCAAAGCAALAFFPGLPYVDAEGVHLGATEVGAHTIHPSFANFGGIPRVARMLWEFDPLLAVLAPLGAIVAGFSFDWRKPDLAVVSAYVVPYLGALVLDPNVQERFLLPLLPYLACLAACALAWIAARIPGPPALGALAVAAPLAVPAWVALRYVRVAAAPDHYEQAAGWIRAHVDPKERILATPGAILPLLVDADSLREDRADPSLLAHPWLVYQTLLPASLPGDPRWKIHWIPISAWKGRRELTFDQSRDLIRGDEADLVLIENSYRMHVYFPTQELERAAADLGELVYRSDGTIPGPEDGLIFEYSGSRQLAARLLTAEAFGPGLRIYRIRRGPRR